MDISIIDSKSLKVRSKKASLIFDPFVKMPKTNADAVILFSNNQDLDFSKVSDYRVIIDGPGDYEVGGIKIAAQKTDKGIICSLNIDGIQVAIGKASDFSKLEGKIDAADIVVANTDVELNPSVMSSLEATVAVLYGYKSKESAKAIGKDGLKPTDKFAITKDKLPEDFQLVLLE